MNNTFTKQTKLTIALTFMALLIAATFGSKGMAQGEVVSTAGGFITTKGMDAKPFYEITWPGTHNSHANNREGGLVKNYNYDYSLNNYVTNQYGLNVKSTASEINSEINKFNSVLEKFNNNIGKVPKAIRPGKIPLVPTLDVSGLGLDTDVSTLNQDLSVKQQLEAGIRFLSLDLIQEESTGTTFLAHGSTDLGKSKIYPMLLDIKNYMAANPNEVVIISIDLLENKKIDVATEVEIIKKGLDKIKSAAKKNWRDYILKPWRLVNLAKNIVDAVKDISGAYKRLSTEFNEMGANTDPSEANKIVMMTQFYNAAVSSGLWNYVAQPTEMTPVGKTALQNMKPNDNNWGTIGSMKSSGRRLVLLPDYSESKYASVVGNYKVNNNTQNWMDFDPNNFKFKQPSKDGRNLSSFTVYPNPNPGVYGSADKAAVEPLNEAWPLYMAGMNVEDTLAARREANDEHLSYYHIQFFEPGYNNATTPVRKGLTVVDACNRINFEKFGYDWSEANVGSNLYWDDETYQTKMARKVLNNNSLYEMQPISAPQNAIDNNPFTNEDRVVKLNFGSPTAVKSLALLCSGEITTVAIYGSKDNATWVKLATGAYANHQGDFFKYINLWNVEDGKWKYIKATVNGTNVRINEVTAFTNTNTTNARTASVAERTADIDAEAIALTAYPNPAVERINIAGLHEGDRVIIRNMTGIKVFETTSVAQKLNVQMQSYPEGIYIVEVSTVDGESKIIKIQKR